jgi:hypothetical protein
MKDDSMEDAILLSFDEDLGAGFDLIVRLADDLIALFQTAGNLNQAR